MTEDMGHDQFSAVALDHAYTPRNFGRLEEHNGYASITGPCGDEMTFWLLVVDDRVARIRFTSTGCGTTLACGSIVTCLAKGRSLEDLMSIEQQDVIAALDGLPEGSRHCALLAASTVKAACENYLRREMKESPERKNIVDSRRAEQEDMQ